MTSLPGLLREKGIRPSKKLGQNFLIHPESAEKIARWSGVEPHQFVLEIGPGLGALTEALHRAGADVVAVEKDPRLSEILSERFNQEPRIQLICKDVLETDVQAILKSAGKRARVVANLPYSVSTPILERLLDFLGEIDGMVLLLQEEVVDRLSAKVGTKEYGRLSIWVQALCAVERGPRIPKGSFHPAPDVESRLVRLTPLPSPRVPEKDLPSFLRVVALLFQHRRKSIRNGLKDAGFEIAKVDRALETSGIEPTARAETQTIEELYRLSLSLER